MLLFISVIKFNGLAEYMFQYISCCYLSEKLTLIECWARGFNTSHVVIYLQLIYSSILSIKSFNTSHVVIYHLLNPCKHCFTGCFNTSHVVIYHYD